MSETITQTITRLTEFIKEKAPNIDVSTGSVFGEIVLGLESQIQNQVYNDISAITIAQNVNDALTSLTDTYSPTIDGLASNFNVTRNQGTSSTGYIKVYVATARNYSIPAGTTFTIPSLNYSYAVINDVLIDYINHPTTALISEPPLYAFLLPVTATVTGKQTAISNGTRFDLSSTTVIPNYVKSEAFGNFTSGIDKETDRALITRFRNGLSSNNLLSAASITSRLSALYPGFCGVYLADVTSDINTRCKDNILNIRVPGSVDVYVKNSTTLPQVTFPIPGSCDGSNWTLEIPSSEAPGFYRITSIRAEGETDLTYLPFATEYSFDADTPNNIPNTSSARFSVYQKADVTISTLDFPAPDPLNTPHTFNVSAIMPFDLPAVQDLFLDNDNRIPCADYLVKGIVPCMVNLKLSLVRKNQNDVVDVAAIQTDIFNYINSIPVGGSVAVSQIVNICHKYGIARVDLPVVLTGKILAPYTSITDPTDSDILISGTDFLEIPYLPKQGVIPGNTMFFISYFSDDGTENINVSVK